MSIKIQRNVFFIFILISALCFLTSVFSGCSKSQPGKDQKTSKEEIIPVKIMRAQSRDMEKTLDYLDNIKAEEEVIVYPKVGGKIIEKLKEEGSSIDKGEVIAYIDRDEVGFQFEKAPVESPISGIVGRIYVDIGTSVTAQTPIALVVAMDIVKVDLDVPEEYIPKIELGQTAEIFIKAYPSEKFKGIVTEISPVLDLNTRTAPVAIKIDNAGHRIKSGMFAEVKLVIEERKGVISILKEAIISKDNGAYVYAVTNDIATKRKIQLGIRQGAYYEVIEGLKRGEKVVIMGQQKLYDGAKVRAEE